ncbi:hypothetical protein QAD02_005319 [Eretmocerus hayati]|uniref:Uncharacterized protein n=1 Tax=Eretmocerus hayati TaxID=131215 RepID=A0ACC2NSJ3_9HYME|nr:hypothetical protein QAD02_005319 [Eretmocerus hayati]
MFTMIVHCSENPAMIDSEKCQSIDSSSIDCPDLSQAQNLDAEIIIDNIETMQIKEDYTVTEGVVSDYNDGVYAQAECSYDPPNLNDQTKPSFVLSETNVANEPSPINSRFLDTSASEVLPLDLSCNQLSNFVGNNQGKDINPCVEIDVNTYNKNNNVNSVVDLVKVANPVPLPIGNKENGGGPEKSTDFREISTLPEEYLPEKEEKFS